MSLPNPPVPSRQVTAVCLLLFFCTLGIFSRSIGNEFLDYDDPEYVTLNPHVQSGLSWQGIRWALSSNEAANWHPLTWLSHQLDWQVYGGSPRGHHASSVLFHSLNAALVFVALRRLSGVFWPSAFCAALFAWHPLRVESVAWVAERKDVLSTFFALFSLWAYARYVQAPRYRRRIALRWYCTALAAFVAGLLSKPMLVTLPCVLLLLDIWPLQRTVLTRSFVSPGPLSTPTPPLRTLLVEKIPFFIFAGISSVITYQVQKQGGAVTDDRFGWSTRMENAVVAGVHYLRDFFWPSGLSVAYPHQTYFAPLEVVGAAALLLGLTAAAFASVRRRPWLFVGWAWFLGTLVPVIGLVQVGLQERADRYTYFPMIGLELALVWSLRAEGVLRSLRAVSWFAAIGILIACGVRTWTQQAYWRDSEALFSHALALTKNNYLAHGYLATTLLNQGRLDEAESHARTAMDLNPAYAAAHYGLGAVLERREQVGEALVSYQQAVQLRPNYPSAHEAAGRMFLRSRLPADAEREFRAALANAPSRVRSFLGLAEALDQEHRETEAMQWYERAAALAPADADAQNRFANALVARGKVTDALPHYEEALRLCPTFAEAHCNFANQLRELGRSAEANTHYRRALALEPGMAEAFYGLGVVAEQEGKLDEAATFYVRAIQLQPNHSAAQYNLGVFLLNRENTLEAREHFLAATRADATFGEAFLALGAVEERLGHVAAALQAYERAVALRPQNADARNALAALRGSSSSPAAAVDGEKARPN